MKDLAIVYDWLDSKGGAERLLKELVVAFPEADWYTSYFGSEAPSWTHDLQINTSFIQKLPKLIRSHRKLSLPLYPFAFESFDFTEYRNVLSVTSSFAKSVITRPETKHLSYMFTPTRYVWHQKNEYIHPFFENIASPYISYLKKWDWTASQRPDVVLTLSEYSARRIKSIYSRKAEVVTPPFSSSYWANIGKNPTPVDELPEKFFLVVSRLKPYKRTDLMIDVATKMKNVSFVFVGSGKSKKQYISSAPNNTLWLENLTDAELAYVYSRAEALIMPQEEEFGYTSVESQFFGTPVISFKDSGAAETILAGKTGVLFNEQTTSSLASAIEKYTTVSYTLNRTTKKLGPTHAAGFDNHTFIDSLKKHFI